MPMERDQCEFRGCREEIWVEPVPQTKCQTHEEEHRRKVERNKERRFQRNEARGLDAIRSMSFTATERLKRQFVAAQEKAGFGSMAAFYRWAAEYVSHDILKGIKGD